jgi:molybdopterin converting factor small subunit
LARLILGGSLQQLADGDSVVEIDAQNVKQLLRMLSERYPALAPHLEQDSFAIAIDGEIFQDIWFAPIGPDSEIHLIPAIRGG